MRSSVLLIALALVTGMATGEEIFVTTVEHGPGSTSTIQVDGDFYTVYRNEIGGLRTSTILGPDGTGSIWSYDYGNDSFRSSQGYTTGDDDGVLALTLLETRRFDSEAVEQEEPSWWQRSCLFCDEEDDGEEE